MHTIDQKKTKNVVTIGPATESEQQIRALIEAGMNVARFNTKHNEPSWHKEVIIRVRQVAQEMGVPIGIFLDLQGPEIRITLKQTPLTCTAGQTVLFTTEEKSTQATDLLVPANVIAGLSVGNRIVMDDGACTLTIVGKTEDSLTARVELDCVIKTRKTVNTPNVVIDMPALTARDEEYLRVVSNDLIDYVGLSFVRTPADIENLRRVMAGYTLSAQVIAKIENRQATDHIDSIIAASDAVMVARGDLGVEIDFEELVYWQKRIIDTCRAAHKPVIVATQMLLSMMEKPTPTRAEVSDIGHAVYDGTDAVMLSEESTIGKYPVQAVATQAKIAAFTEQYTSFSTQPPAESPSLFPNTFWQHLQTVDACVLVGESLDLVRLLSSTHNKQTLIAVTTSAQFGQQLTLSYGVQVVITSDIANLTSLLKPHLKLGQTALVVYTSSSEQHTTLYTQT